MAIFVQIAVDMVLESGSNKNSFLVGSDSALLPAVRAAIRSGVRVVYVGVADCLTRSLVQHASSTTVIRDAETVEAFKRANSS